MPVRVVTAYFDDKVTTYEDPGTRGELERAEEMDKKSLAIEEKLGRPKGMAIQYGNLGLIAKDRGDFAGARDLWTRPAIYSPRAVRRTGSRWCRAGSMGCHRDEGLEPPRRAQRLRRSRLRSL